jgi:hypothetical protein
MHHVLMRFAHAVLLLQEYVAFYKAEVDPLLDQAGKAKEEMALTLVEGDEENALQVRA